MADEDPYAALAKPAAESGGDPYTQIARSTSAPNAGLAPAAGAPPKTLNSGEGPIAQGLTSFETGLANAPRGIYQAARGLPEQMRQSDLEHERVLSGEESPWNEFTHALSRFNPVATEEGSWPRNIGRTAANLFPFAVDVGGEGIAESPIGRGVRSISKEAATAPIRLAARGAETAINQKLVPLRPLANINLPADAAETTQFKVPGRNFGLRTPAPRVIAEPDLTGTNKPYAGAPKPRAEILDATKENKPFAGGMDEAAESSGAAPTETQTKIARPETAQATPRGITPVEETPDVNDIPREEWETSRFIEPEIEGTPRGDLTQQLQQSLADVEARKGIVRVNNAATSEPRAITAQKDAYPVKITYDEHGIPTAETDGRHRVIQAIESGQERIPVVVNRGHGPVETTVDPKVLARQMGVTKESLAATDEQQIYRKGNLQPRKAILIPQ